MTRRQHEVAALEGGYFTGTSDRTLAVVGTVSVGEFFAHTAAGVLIVLGIFVGHSAIVGVAVAVLRRSLVLLL
jgi:hypothetical protein